MYGSMNIKFRFVTHLLTFLHSSKTGVLDSAGATLQSFKLSGITHTVTQHPIPEDWDLQANVGCSFDPQW